LAETYVTQLRDKFSLAWEFDDANKLRNCLAELQLLAVLYDARHTAPIDSCLYQPLGTKYKYSYLLIYLKLPC